MSAKIDLNVRATPSASGDIVCTVEKGYPFKYISKKGKWIQVQDEPLKASDGVCKGWVYHSFNSYWHIGFVFNDNCASIIIGLRQLQQALRHIYGARHIKTRLLRSAVHTIVTHPYAYSS